MAPGTPPTRPADDWPDAPKGRDVVLHTRVVTETGGGPDKTILLSAPFLADTNYWLAAAYMHPPDDPGFAAIRQRADAYGCPLISVPDRGPLDGGVLRRMLALCRHFNVRIWHGHDYKSNLIGLMLRPFWQMKFVTTVHGWVKHTTRTPLYYAVDRWSLPYYHHVICVSADLLERVRRLKVPPQRSSLVPNAIDEKTFRRRGPAGEASLRRRFNTPPDRIVIGAVGRLSPEKAFNNLIQSVKVLIDEGRDVELWIAGQGDSRADLERLIEHLGVGQRVRLLGFCDDMIGLYEAMDVFALSSLREGLPNVVLEAMAMQTPVASTRVAGVPGIITDNETGLLCQVGDVGELAAALGRLVTDEALRTRLAAAGRAIIEQQYSFTQRMARVRDIYDNVLGISRGADADAATSPRQDVKLPTSSASSAGHQPA